MIALQRNEKYCGLQNLIFPFHCLCVILPTKKQYFTIYYSSFMRTIALMFGGKSPEHDISIRSARNIYGAIDKNTFQVVLLGVGRSGKWYEVQAADFVVDDFEVDEKGSPLSLIPGVETGQLHRLADGTTLPNIEAVFLIIHGPNGEDGTIQGLLSQLNLPFTGPGVMASAIAMDKDVCKRLFLQAGLLSANAMVFQKHEMDSIDYAVVCNQLGSPVFIKPANMGSSVGVSKATDKAEFEKAVNLAFQFDTKILIEEMLVGRELECAVLGNELAAASGVGEVVITKGFYDYESKYINDDAKTVIPAENISESVLAKIQTIARQAYQVLGCEGLSRVDMFLTAEEDVYINEINTLPGFTSISMYPKLWEAAGLPYSQLIEELISLAIARKKREDALQRSR